MKRTLVTLTAMICALIAITAGAVPQAESSPGENQAPKATKAPLPDQPPAMAQENWPGFRGVQASGNAVGKGLPLHWDSATGENIRWKTPIPGLGHSAPVVWGKRVFLTTAVNTESAPLLRTDMGGATDSHDEQVAHHFRVYCLDLESGKIAWERTAYTGIPQVKRHAMSSHANSTPATDGKHVVAFFGSEGLYCYDFDGKLLWQVDLGYLDATWFRAPEDQWGFGSSPIIHDGKVIVVCDVHNQSFIAAFDVATGKELWRTQRDEIPGWGSPSVHTSAQRNQVIVNGFQHIGGYDLETGKALWWMKGGGDIPVPTPIVAHGLTFITNSHGRMRPIYAIRLDATGDISLAEQTTANDNVVWSSPRRGAYMPTPIVVGDYLYLGNDGGVLTCYRATTGEQVFRERIGGRQASFVGSAVAGAGRLYYTDENCQTHVLAAADSYQHLGTSSLTGVCLSTPAIAGSTLLMRTSTHLYGIGDTGGKPGVKDQPSPARESTTAEETPAKPLRTDWSDTELSDPVEILSHADALTAAVKAVRYQVSFEGLEAVKEQYPAFTATVTASGGSYFPDLLKVESEYQPEGSERKVLFTGGFDGNRYYAIDRVSKIVYSDFEGGVVGSWRNFLFNSVLFEFHTSAPFQQEIATQAVELLGTKEMGGVPCYEIRVVWDAEGGREAIWYIGKQDLLPRARTDLFQTQDGQPAGVRKILSQLQTEPELAPGAFDFTVPQGYTESDQPPQ